MKCEQCNHEAVKIKKNHFCPSCGKKVINKEGLSNISPALKNPAVSSDISKNKITIDKKETNILNLKENITPSNSYQVLPKVDKEQLKDDAKEEGINKNLPEHIKNIIEKHTEPNGNLSSANKNNIESIPSLSTKSNVTKNIAVPNVTNISKVESQVKSPENVFASKKNEIFWDKPVEKKSMMPTKKEKTLKTMLILVVALNVLVILGIVYLLLT